MHKKMNHSFRKAILSTNHSEMNRSDISNFTPKITSSPSARRASSSCLVHYGENNLGLSVSSALLTITPQKGSNSKLRHVEKCRGGYAFDSNSNNNERFELSTYFSEFKSNHYLDSTEPELSCPVSNQARNQDYFKQLQKIQFEAGLKNHLINCYKSNKQAKQAAESYISSIYVSKSESKTLVNCEKSCNCCTNSTESSLSSSFASESNSNTDLNTYLTFDVKMASTPKTYKHRNYNIEKISIKKMSKRLAENECNTNCSCNLARNVEHKHSQKIKLRNELKLKAMRENVDLTSNGIVNCNDYLKRLLKKSNSGQKTAKKMSQIQKLQLKRIQKLSNVSTSTKLENVKFEKLHVKKRSAKLRTHSTSGRKDYVDLKRKTIATFAKNEIIVDGKAKLGSAAEKQPAYFKSENLFSLNSYFQNTGLNKFNQLGQLQVWYV